MFAVETSSLSVFLTHTNSFGELEAEAFLSHSPVIQDRASLSVMSFSPSPFSVGRVVHE